MMTLFGSQRKLADALGVSHQKVGRWLREGEKATIDPETGEQLKSAGIKQIPAEASGIINAVFDVYKQVTRQQAKVDGLFYDSRVPVFMNRPLMNNGKPGLRVFVEHTQYLRPEIRINFTALVQRTKEFILASYRSEINIFSYIGATPKESSANATPRATRSRQRRYTTAGLQKPAEQIIDAGGRLMPIFTKYENISPGTSTGLVIKNLEAKLEKHSPHAVKLADMWLFQLKSTPSQNETPAKKRTIQRATARRTKRGK